MLKKTPFHSRTAALMQANQWRRWSGHTVASSYEMTHDREYLAIRNACVLIDVSPLCKYKIHGKDAMAYLNRLVTRDVSKCTVGGMLYTPWCDSRGKVIDDGTIARLGENEYRLTSAEPNLRWLEDNAIGYDVKIDEVTDDLGTLALQGPRSRDLLKSLTGEKEGLDKLEFYRFLNTKIAGVPVMISRTGYTGDLGYEIWMAADKAEGLWDAFIETGKGFGMQPAGIWALDVARIEAGLIMCGIDYTPANHAMTDGQTSSALEIGFSWAISWKKGNFVGRKALKAEKQKGSSTLLVGLEIDHKEFERQHHALGLTAAYPFMAWREMIPLFANGEQVGYATSGVWSPTLKKYIALGHVRPSHAVQGNTVQIDLPVDRFRKRFDCKITGLPFFSPARKKDTI